MTTVGVDRMSLAAKRNRANKSQLESELNRIEKEKENEIRMHNNERQRFKSKYSKLDVFQQQNNDTGNPAFFRMYETHNPGFCYRRNGECRVPQAASFTPSVNYQDIHDLLFTNGEVDIEKVLCLHLLSTHKTETLTPPPKATNFQSRDQSPLERLIERSKKRHVESTFGKLLPTYVLDFEETKNSDNKENKKNKKLISDGRLAARLLVNDKITKLIDTVLSALQNSNPEKMEELITLAGDPAALKEIVAKPDIQNFIRILMNHTLISSCESFHLTAPFKKKSLTLEMTADSESLKNLVQFIRKNVLQVQPQSVWKELHQKNLQQVESLTLSVASSKKETKDEKGSSMASRDKSKSSVSSTKSRPNFINKNIEAVSNVRSRNSSVRSSDERLNRRRSSSTTASSKRKDSASTVKASFLEDDEEMKEEFRQFKTQEKALLEQEYGIDLYHESDPNFISDNQEQEEMDKIEDMRKNMDYKDLAVMLNKKVKAAYKRDIKTLQTTEYNQEDDEDPANKKKAQEPQLPPAKMSLKQTTCEACLEKWKQPLPPPKTSSIKKYSIPVLDQEAYNVVKTRSTHRISLIIDQELEKVNTLGERRGSKNSSILSRNSKSISQNNISSQFSNESVVLNDLDLAKIRQEIRERETQKKLQNFLNSTI